MDSLVFTFLREEIREVSRKVLILSDQVMPGKGIPGEVSGTMFCF